MTPRICIVGLGSIGSKHVDTLLTMEYTDLVAVEPRPMPHEERLPVVDTFEDVESWEPTHAIICSPPEFHYHHARFFLDRGIPTFIEKPMTHISVEAKVLCEIASINRTVLAVGYMERAHPTVLAARQWAQKNKPNRAEVFCYWRATEKSYRLNVCDESSHAIDTALFIMGEVARAERRGGSQVRGYAVLHHASASTEIVMDMGAGPRRRIQMYGDGSSSFMAEYGTTAEEWTACYRTELQAFLDGKPLCTGEDGAKVMDILEKVR